MVNSLEVSLSSQLLLARRLARIALCVILGVSIMPRESQALLIDDYSTAQAALVDFSGGTTTGSAVSGAGIIGGERDAFAGSNTGGSITGATRFEVSGGLARASVDPFGVGQVRTDYDGPGVPYDLTSSLSLDLTDGGSSDRFIIEVSSVTGVVALSINVGLSGGQIPSFLQSPSFTNVMSPGSVEILFSSFQEIAGPLPTPTFNAAQQIAFFMIMDAGEAIDIGAFCTGAAGAACTSSQPPAAIPEPSSLLLAFGALAAAVSRRRFWRKTA